MLQIIKQNRQIPLRSLQGDIDLSDLDIFVNYDEERKGMQNNFLLKYGTSLRCMTPHFQGFTPIWEEETPVLDEESGEPTGQFLTVRKQLPIKIPISINEDVSNATIQGAKQIVDGLIAQQPQLEPRKDILQRLVEKHLPVKLHLEEILGEGMVVIRFDLIGI